jgi:hypothetical protein
MTYRRTISNLWLAAEQDDWMRLNGVVVPCANMIDPVIVPDTPEDDGLAVACPLTINAEVSPNRSTMSYWP